MCCGHVQLTVSLPRTVEMPGQTVRKASDEEVGKMTRGLMVNQDRVSGARSLADAALSHGGGLELCPEEVTLRMGAKLPRKRKRCSRSQRKPSSLTVTGQSTLL